jgi:phosphorylcholine metabolism protein LicD
LRLNNIPYWIDYAILLAYVRKQPALNVWDHDFDYSILQKDTHKAVNYFKQYGFHTIVAEERYIEHTTKLIFLSLED